jgi:glycosyltransferase involved in cell wall biosynthesis
MNILYHHRTQGTGIESVHIMGMVTGFRNLGHFVKIVGPPGIDPESCSQFSPSHHQGGLRILWKNVSEHVPEIFFEFLEIVYNFYSFFRLLIFLKANKVDFIYERYALFQFGGVVAACVKKLPIILEVNDSALVERSRPLKNKRMAVWFERRIFKNADVLVTISTYFKNRILSYNIHSGKVHVLPNAINPDILDPQRYEGYAVKKKYHLESNFIIGFVGLFVPWHGLLVLLDVFAKLAAKNDSMHLLLVGDGPERATIEGRIREIDLKDKVTITGYVLHHRVPAFIKTFDVAVMPNSNEHGSPMKIFEYMSMAKPIVAPSYSPIQEVLADGKNALLFEPNDEKGLCLALETLIDDEELRRRLGENGRRDVLAKHTWQNNAVQILRKLDCAGHALSRPPSSRCAHRGEGETSNGE